jgi:putative nucleotidyltransferase-like protein
MTADQYNARRAVLACFRRLPEVDEFMKIAADEAGSHGTLLKWLDESGLALYLTGRLQDRGLLERIDTKLYAALEARLQANRRRTSILLSEFGRVNAALQCAGVRYAAVKGFTLTNEFCPEPWLRHQSDIDLLMVPGEVESAIEALNALGYQLEPDEGSGEVCLAIRSEHVPSANDFLYDPPHHSHVEIHTALYEPYCGVSLDVGREWAGHIEWREIASIRYPSLDLPYRFVVQVLHAFRHIPSWARVAWLYEIAYFAEHFEDDNELWRKIDALVAGEKERNACGIVCTIVADTFGASFPTSIQEKWIEPLPSRYLLWMKDHAERWMLSDFLSGSKAGLLLHRHFADSRRTWWSYRISRYRKALKTLRTSEHTGPRFLVERARKQVDYLWQSVRWSVRN